MSPDVGRLRSPNTQSLEGPIDEDEVAGDDGTVVAIEVKASERAPGGDFRGLGQLRAALGPRFAAGIILTTGTRSYTYADRLHVMPIDRLWTPVTLGAPR